PSSSAITLEKAGPVKICRSLSPTTSAPCGVLSANRSARSAMPRISASIATPAREETDEQHECRFGRLERLIARVQKPDVLDFKGLGAARRKRTFGVQLRQEGFAPERIAVIGKQLQLHVRIA